MWEDRNFSWTIPVVNRGFDVIVIESWNTSCACVEIEPPGMTLAAGQRKDVRLTLNLSWRSRDAEQHKNAVSEAELRLIPRLKQATRIPPVLRRAADCEMRSA